MNCLWFKFSIWLVMRLLLKEICVSWSASNKSDALSRTLWHSCDLKRFSRRKFTCNFRSVPCLTQSICMFPHSYFLRSCRWRFYCMIQLSLEQAFSMITQSVCFLFLLLQQSLNNLFSLAYRILLWDIVLRFWFLACTCEDVSIIHFKNIISRTLIPSNKRVFIRCSS